MGDSFLSWPSYPQPSPRPKRPPWVPWEVPRATVSKRHWARHKYQLVDAFSTHLLQHVETSSTHSRGRRHPTGSRLPTVLARLYAGEQTHVDKVQELEERFTKPHKSRKTKKPKEVAKKTPKTMKKTSRSGPPKRVFNPSDMIKGQRGIPVTKGTTLRSFIRMVWWGRKPLVELLRKSVRLVDGQFFNKRTTLLSLMRNVPCAKKPLVDVMIANKRL